MGAAQIVKEGRDMADCMSRRLGRRIGRRGAALLFFALLDYVYGFSLSDPPPEVRRTTSVAFVHGIAPLWLWATLWFSAAVICTVGAFARRDRWAFTVAISIKVLWGSLFLAGWVLYGLQRGYVAAAVWLSMAAFVYIISTWPEPPTAAPLVDYRGGDVR